MNHKSKSQLTIILLCILTTGILAQSSSVITYVETDSIFSNPERGFSAITSSIITPSFINSLKVQNVSIVWRIYTIPQFNNQALSTGFLSLVENDMNTAREGGVKVVPRFSYTSNIDGADAPLDTILMHISQLEPIFQDNYDVIAYMDAGFIGAWGEWYYSTNGLNNTNDRRTVLYALLDALPTERAVAVRTPEYKRSIFEDDLPLNMEDAFSETHKARTGAHNDCFLASETDYGTYGNVEVDKTYLNLDNRFVPQGGETCNPSEYSGCGNALIDLDRMHWSIINKDYHTDVLNGWQSNGCMDDIKRRLGYRFSLLEANIVDDLKPEGIFSLDFKIKNDGFASPFNGRLLEIILRNMDTEQTYRLVTDEDPRFWSSGDTASISVSGGLPNDITEGSYDVLLHIADPEPRLRNRADYAIRLANEDVWEAPTGYNSLLHQIEISNSASGENYIGDNFFELFVAESQPPVQPTTIILDGEFADWQDVPQLDISPDEETSGDGHVAAADIVDIWVTNDDDNLYISYKLNGSYGGGYFYHVFFDTDGDTSTGFHSVGSYAGIDYMLENTNLYLYSGVNGGWGWTSAGTVGVTQGTSDPTRVEFAVDRSILASSGALESVDLLFNVNNLNAEVADDYAPNAYQERSYSYPFLVTGLKDRKDIYPNDIQLSAFPNPFNNSVTIEVKAGHSNIETVSIYDVVGRKVYEFAAGLKNQQKLIWNSINQKGEAVGSGLYFLKVSTSKQTTSQKLILIK